MDVSMVLALTQLTGQIEEDLSRLPKNLEQRGLAFSSLLKIWISTFMGNAVKRAKDSPIDLKEITQHDDASSRTLEICLLFCMARRGIHAVRLGMPFVIAYNEAVYYEAQRDRSIKPEDTVMSLTMRRLREARDHANEKIEELLKKKGTFWERERYEATFHLSIDRDPLCPTHEQAAVFKDESGAEIGKAGLGSAGSFSASSWRSPTVTEESSLSTSTGLSVTYSATHHSPFTIEITTQDTWNTPARPYSTLVAQPIRS